MWCGKPVLSIRSEHEGDSHGVHSSKPRVPGASTLLALSTRLVDSPIRSQDSAFISQWKIQLRASSPWSHYSPGSQHSPNGLTSKNPGLCIHDSSSWSLKSWSHYSPGSQHSPNGLSNQNPGLFSHEPMRGRANGPEPGIPEASLFLAFFYRLMDWPFRTQESSFISQWKIQLRASSLWSLSSPGSQHSPNGLTNQNPGRCIHQPMKDPAQGLESLKPLLSWLSALV